MSQLQIREGPHCVVDASCLRFVASATLWVLDGLAPHLNPFARELKQPLLPNYRLKPLGASHVLNIVGIARFGCISAWALWRWNRNRGPLLASVSSCLCPFGQVVKLVFAIGLEQQLGAQFRPLNEPALELAS